MLIKKILKNFGIRGHFITLPVPGERSTRYRPTANCHIRSPHEDRKWLTYSDAAMLCVKEDIRLHSGCFPATTHSKKNMAFICMFSVNNC